jgi:hypothetical protein
MRLLFERDLTPYPQYCAVYKKLQQPFELGARETENTCNGFATAVQREASCILHWMPFLRLFLEISESLLYCHHHL